MVRMHFGLVWLQPGRQLHPAPSWGNRWPGYIAWLRQLLQGSIQISPLGTSLVEPEWRSTQCHGSLSLAIWHWSFSAVVELVLRVRFLFVACSNAGIWSEAILARGRTKVSGYSVVQLIEVKNQSNCSKRGSCCMLLQVKNLPLRGSSTKPSCPITSMKMRVSCRIPLRFVPVF